MMLHCNVASHWLGTYTKWSLLSCHDALSSLGATEVVVMFTLCAHKRHTISHPSTKGIFCKCVGENWLCFNSLRLSNVYMPQHPRPSLVPTKRQAVIWNNDGILLTGPLGTNLNEIFIRIHAFSFRKIYLKMLSGKCQPFCLSLNVLTESQCIAFKSSVYDDAHSCLTHWGRNKMAAVFLRTFSKAFSSLKTY